MYLVDANILIDAKNRYYAFDIAPGFWNWLERARRQNQVISIDAVRDELLLGDDELAVWAHDHREFFLPIDQATTTQFAPLLSWVRRQSYRPAAVNEFTTDQADFLLIAHAMQHECTVVTLESPSPVARKRVKIPDVCVAMDVPTVNTFAMLRATGAQLHLHAPEASTIVPDAPTLPGLE